VQIFEREIVSSSSRNRASGDFDGYRIFRLESWHIGGDIVFIGFRKEILPLHAEKYAGYNPLSLVQNRSVYLSLRRCSQGVNLYGALKAQSRKGDSA
jgi:hypothetical protein